MSIKTAERNSGVLPEDNVIHHRHLIAYNEAKKHIKGKVLEIGSGEGYGLKILAPGSTEYVAIDKHQTPLDGSFDNVIFKQINIPPLKGVEENYFDYVVSFQVIEHIKDDHFFLSEICRVLKPGGTLMLTTPNIKMSLTRNPWHIREYNPDQITRIFKKSFSDVQLFGVYGKEKVMKYYEENRRSVKKFTRFDIFNFQYLLPSWMLKIPYDIANRMNRNKLHKSKNQLVQQVTTEDFFISQAADNCFDFFVVAQK